MLIGYHASHEQFAPSELLRCVALAERAGFGGAMCSDHFHPWGAAQGHSGHAIAWIGAALQATRFPIGMIHVPMGWRYPPAVSAQALATLAEMFPGRLWAALGTGEALNESILGEPWPTKAERRARLGEAVGIVRRLLGGEEVTHDGALRVRRARLYTRPREPPPLHAAALSPETAAWAASWADGLITVATRDRSLMRRVASAYRDAGGRGPLLLQLHVAWGADEEAALVEAREQWGTNLVVGPVSQDLPHPEDFDAIKRFVRPEDVRGHVLVGADPAAHAEALAEFAGMGFERTFVHHVGRDQSGFIEAYGREVLPLAARRQ